MLHVPELGIFKTQKPVDYIDTTITINTFETVSANLSGGLPAKLWYIIVEQTNNGATDETIDLEVTINGTAYNFTGSCVSGTRYYGVMTEQLAAGDFEAAFTTIATAGSALSSANVAIPFVADSVGLIRVQQTTDVDLTAAQIEVNIVWEKLEGV